MVVSVTSMLNLQALRDTPLKRDPFDHVVVPGFLGREALQRLESDFPAVDGPGSYPLHALTFGPAFRELSEDLQGPDLTDVIGDKFGLPLNGHPTMLTVRGHCRPTDGRIHTDSQGKLMTALLYINAGWESDGGRLRLLRSSDDLDDFAAEVPPDAGTLLVFRCSPNAWHGHKPFDGVRRSVQLNWVRDVWYLRKEQFRHRLSAVFKRASS